MKVRLGFVSNSSSSSYTCDISGQTESGWDSGLSDVGMVESHWGIYCEQYLLKPWKKLREEFEKSRLPDDDEFDVYELRSNIPDEYCPLFNLKYVMIHDVLVYLLKQTNQTEEQVKEVIQKRFSNLKEFRDFINSTDKI